ncbi:hypothetical protein B7494_g3296 [Chlorociboria aeruginascens]|nr:hypothetical protein B7494_g3296 [Chlorociboria aeruginascens]
MGSVVLPHLETGWHVDQAIITEEERLVVIRFGRDWDPDCMRQDEVLYRIADLVKNFAVIYVCDLDQVPDFNQMYELYDKCTLMFFFRNKHMMCDFGTGNNNKLNWVLEDKQELIDIIETIYRGAKKGRGLVIIPQDIGTRFFVDCNQGRRASIEVSVGDFPVASIRGGWALRWLLWNAQDSALYTTGLQPWRYLHTRYEQSFRPQIRTSPSQKTVMPLIHVRKGLRLTDLYTGKRAGKGAIERGMSVERSKGLKSNDLWRSSTVPKAALKRNILSTDGLLDRLDENVREMVDRIGSADLEDV